VSTWIEAYLAGDASLDDIDEWVERWHNVPGDMLTAALHGWLGMSEDEYKRWVENPGALEAIVSQYQRVRCKGCEAIVTCRKYEKECPECGFDAFGLGWAGGLDHTGGFSITVAPSEGVEQARIALLSALRLQDGPGAPDLLGIAQMAAFALVEARGNYAGACEDLKEIRRVVGAGEGSNVRAVTDAWDEQNQSLRILQDRLFNRDRQLEYLYDNLKDSRERSDRLHRAVEEFLAAVGSHSGGAAYDKLKAALDLEE
jgi:hypothetical protein